MKRNFIIYTALSAIFAFVSMAAAAQEKGISVSGVNITSSSEGPRLDMTVVITPGAVTNLQSIAIVPTLSDGAGNSVRFPHVLVNGKNRTQIYERHEKFGYTEIVENPPYLVMNIDPRHPGGKIDYSAPVTGQAWMANASLSLAFVLVSPAGERQAYSTAVSGTSVVTIPEAATIASQPTVVDTRPAPQPVAVQPQPQPVYQPQPVAVQPQPQPVAQVQPQPAYQQPAVQPQPQPVYQPQPIAQVQPQPAYQQPAVQPQPQPQPAYQQPVYQPAPQPQPVVAPANVRTLSGTANLDFAASSAVLQPSLGRNPQELAKVDEAVAHIVATTGASIVSVTITGYSSVEGSNEANAAVSYDRAVALSRYMQERYGIVASAVKLRAVGEDWSGLRAAVAASNLPYINEILKVIDGPQAPDAKESLLRRMMAGQIWQRMEREIFPGLRKVDFSIDYGVVE